MTLADRLRDHVREHRSGMVVDLVFAVAWVTVVTVLVDLLGAPRWVSYLLLLSGVPAYLLFFASLAAARENA